MHLSKSLGLISEPLRWVPHRPSDIEKEARVEKSEDVLQLLLSMKHQSWKFIVTLDDAWLYLYPEFETIRLSPGEPRTET
jgi:hypothetical protein